MRRRARGNRWRRRPETAACPGVPTDLATAAARGVCALAAVMRTMVGRFSALGWIARIGVSATILCLVFSLVPLGHVAAVLSDVDGLWLTLALAVLLLEQVVFA